MSKADIGQAGGASSAPGLDQANGSTLMTAAEAAAELRMHLKTFYRFRRRCGLPCVRVGSRVRYFRSDVLRWLSARREA
jgi:excisionase family DNA binding protein